MAFVPSQDITVTLDLRQPLASADEALLAAVIPEFRDELPQPQNVELVTDRYQQVAGEYEVRALHRANEEMTAADDEANKPDGSMAVGRTIVLPNDCVVVVVPSPLLQVGLAITRRTLLHEAQHVRLAQHGDDAHAVHRRVSSFSRPDDLTWEFLWLAESAIDEFRCERAMYERSRADTDSGPVAGDYPPIRALFDRTLSKLARTSDVLAAYHESFQALERLSVYLAYGAAKLTVHPEAIQQWTAVPPMAALLSIMREIPSPDERLAKTSIF